MPSVNTPAVQALVAQISDELRFAQVLIRRAENGFELRHVDDRERAAAALRELKPADLRALAQFTAGGAFRPLKSAPHLQSGWLFRAREEAELEDALNRLYPGAVADWFAARGPRPPVTNYGDFTRRQSGMYRIAAMLTDTQAAAVIRACCHPTLCLKRRLWTVTGLAPDAAGQKSLIPCLEPCALLLELARKAMRLEQEKKIGLELSPDEAAALAAAIETALAHPDRDTREADFEAPNNPRRWRLLLEKVRPLLAARNVSEGE